MSLQGLGKKQTPTQYYSGTGKEKLKLSSSRNVKAESQKVTWERQGLHKLFLAHAYLIHLQRLSVRKTASPVLPYACCEKLFPNISLESSLLPLTRFFSTHRRHEVSTGTITSLSLSVSEWKTTPPHFVLPWKKCCWEPWSPLQVVLDFVYP